MPKKATKKSPVESALARRALPAPQGKAQQKVEELRAQILADLARIAAEVTAYATSGRVDYGHAGDLGAVLTGLSELHMVGAAYKLEAAR